MNEKFSTESANNTKVKFSNTENDFSLLPSVFLSSPVMDSDTVSENSKVKIQKLIILHGKGLGIYLCPVALSVSAESLCLSCKPHNKVLKIHQSKSDSIWVSLWVSFFIWSSYYIIFLCWKLFQYDKIHFLHFLDCEFVFLLNKINRRPWGKRN